MPNRSATFSEVILGQNSSPAGHSSGILGTRAMHATETVVRNQAMSPHSQHGHGADRSHHCWPDAQSSYIKDTLSQKREGSLHLQHSWVSCLSTEERGRKVYWGTHCHTWPASPMPQGQALSHGVMRMPPGLWKGQTLAFCSPWLGLS